LLQGFFFFYITAHRQEQPFLIPKVDTKKTLVVVRNLINVKLAWVTAIKDRNFTVPAVQAAGILMIFPFPR
jgi:hypothetical protein